MFSINTQATLFGISSAAVLVVAAPFVASGQQATATTPSVAAGALRAVVQRLNSAQEITFSAIDRNFDKTGRQIDYKAYGRLAKPNLASIKVMPVSGPRSQPTVLINSDGASYTIASLEHNEYVASPASKDGIDSDSTEADYFLYDVVGDAGTTGQNIADALLSTDDDISDEKVPAGIKGIVTTTSRNVTPEGHAYLGAAQKVQGARHTSIHHTVLEPKTGTLASLVQYDVVSGAPNLTERVEFVDIKLSSATPKIARFAYTPPASTAVCHDAGPGSVAPDFTVAKADGTSVQLSDYKGKVVVIDFWPTWCPACLKTLPSTDKLASRYQPKGAVFLPICTWDTKARFDSWLPAHSSWTMSRLFDNAGEDAQKSIATSPYVVSGIPTQCVIGKDGVIVYRGYADSDAGEALLAATIKKAMAAG